MTGNQTIDYYVRPRHLYSHSRTCTRSGLCSITFLICGIPHMLPPWLCQCSWDFSSHNLIIVYVRYLQPLWRSWSIMYLQLLWRSQSTVYIHHGDSDLLYIIRDDDHTCHVLYIMPIHGHCTLMYLGLLHVFAVTCRYLSLYCTHEWLVLPPGFSLLHLWDGFYNVFRPSCYPSYLTH